MTRPFRSACAAAALALAAGPAAAEYPEKPVSFVVPWPPGDLEDVLTRIVAEEFQSRYGVAAAVVNKPGGGGGPFPGAIEVAQAPADGYTVGSFVIGVPALGHTLGIPELAPEKFDPVGIFLTYPFVLAASKDAGFSTLEEMAAYARDHELALGHFGAALAPTRVSFALAREMGFDWGSEAAFDALDCNTLASGDADVINTTLQLILPCLDEVTVLASITDQRIPLTPDAPTVGEVVPALSLALWNGLFVRKEVPAEVRAKIAEAAEAAVTGARAQEVAASTGALVYWQDAGAAAARIARDRETLGRIADLLQ